MKQLRGKKGEYLHKHTHIHREEGVRNDKAMSTMLTIAELFLIGF